MANFYVDPPDEMEEDINVNVSNLYNKVVELVRALNYGMNNIDTDNMIDEIAEILNKSEGD